MFWNDELVKIFIEKLPGYLNQGHSVDSAIEEFKEQNQNGSYDSVVAHGQKVVVDRSKARKAISDSIKRGLEKLNQ